MEIFLINAEKANFIVKTNVRVSVAVDPGFRWLHVKAEPQNSM